MKKSLEKMLPRVIPASMESSDTTTFSYATYFLICPFVIPNNDNSPNSLPLDFINVEFE
jgi:hypothetical protein